MTDANNYVASLYSYFVILLSLVREYTVFKMVSKSENVKEKEHRKVRETYG